MPSIIKTMAKKQQKCKGSNMSEKLPASLAPCLNHSSRNLITINLRHRPRDSQLAIFMRIEIVNTSFEYF